MIVISTDKTDEEIMRGKKHRAWWVIEETAEKKKEEEALHQYLLETFNEIHKKHTKTFAQIGEVFLKVSGDLQALWEYFDGKKVIEWTYMEDLTLKKPPTSTEFQCLLKLKGQTQIDIRKAFLSDFAQGSPILEQLGGQNS